MTRIVAASIRMQFVCHIVLAIALLNVAAAGFAADNPPNILLILTDDQGAGDLGSAGNPVLDTPRLDRLASQSTSFRRFYVSPVCTPTRASLMTGRWSTRTRAIDTFRGRAMMDPKEITVAEMMQQAGYATGLFGKWHLGDCYPMRPMDQGFDHVLMHRGGGLGQPSDSIHNERRYTDPILLRNGEEVQTEGFCMDVYVDEAIKFIEQSVGDERPFFAYVSTNTPHSPFHDVPEALYEKYGARDLTQVVDNPARIDDVARIFAMVENIDSNVGRLLDTLDRLEIADDTLVIYLHDNGPAIARYVGDMRGRKSTVYEGGIRTPCFVRWPGRVPAGVVRDEIAAHVDIWPTMVEVAGIEPPEDLIIDGRSLWPLLTGNPESAWPERMLFIQAHRGDVRVARHQFAVIGTRYKLLRASGFGRETPPPDSPFELYDIIEDPFEHHNLAEEKPEIVKDLLAAHDEWFHDVTSGEGYGTPPRIVVGSADELRTVLTRNDWRPTEGGGYGLAGTWALFVPSAVRPDLEVWFRAPVESPQLVLKYGGITHAVDMAGSTVTKVSLGPIHLPEGPCDFSVHVTTSDGELVAPEHVVLTHHGGE